MLLWIHHGTGSLDLSSHLYNKDKCGFIKKRLGNMRDEKAGCIWKEMQVAGIFSSISVRRIPGNK